MAYSANYDNNGIRSGNYDVYKYIYPLLKATMIAVDLGCGTCRKTVQIAPHVNRVDCVDINNDMLAKAVINISASKLQNMRLCHADNMDVPLQSHSYDLCTAFLTTWSPSEAHRLLRGGGLFFIETLCANDKLAMKMAFGKDKYGWRGRFLNQDAEERLYYIRQSLRPFFDILSLDVVSFQTTLTREGLINLLSSTPTVRDFSLSKDEHIVDELLRQETITMIERRVLILARQLQTGGYNEH